MIDNDPLVAALRLEAWRETSSPRRREVAGSLADRHAETLELLRTDLGEFGLPVFAHKASGVLLRLVPGGAFEMGMSDAELARLQERYSFFNDADAADRAFSSPTLRPPTRVDLPAFLLAERPLDGRQLEWLLAPPDRRAGHARGEHPPPRDYVKVIELRASEYVAYLDKTAAAEVDNHQVDAVERALHELGLRLPSDAEWERAARGGDGRAFASGDAIPRTPSTGVNPFGYADLGATCDVCADGAVATLAGLSADGHARPPGVHRIVRGGAANVWPWQDCGEWTLLACALRHSMESEDGLLAIRPAMSV